MGELGQDLFAGAALMLVRVFAAVRLTPFVGGKPVPVVAAGGLSAVLVLLLVPSAPLASAPEGAAGWFLAALAEVCVGLSYGLFARIVFSVLETAGGLVRVTVGTPEPLEPIPGGGTGVDAFFVLLGLCAFLLLGGHRAMIGALAASFDLVPVGAGLVDSDLLGFLGGAGGVFAGAFGWAVVIAVPVLAVKIGAEIVSSLLSKMAPTYASGGSAELLRLVAAHLAFIAALGGGVRVALAFLEEGIRSFPGAAS